MRKVAHFALAGVLALAAAASVTMWATWRASQQVPAFYREALAAPPADQKAAGQQFERQALALHNEIRRTGRWEARFSQSQINGWLASEMPAKFPRVLPVGVSEPRVALDEGSGKVAVRYEKGDVKTVVSLTGEVYLTEESNEVAIHIKHVRAGALPVPLAQFLDKIAERATRAGFPLRWSEVDGSPVALVKLPLDPREFRGRQLLLEELRLTDEELVVSGRTEDGQPLEVAGHVSAPNLEPVGSEEDTDLPPKSAAEDASAQLQQR